jgi:signal peptidase
MSDPAGGADPDGPSDDSVADRRSGPTDADGPGGSRSPDGVDGSDGTGASDGSGGSGDPADAPDGLLEWLQWFWTTDSGTVVYVRDVVTSVVAVLLVGLLLFGISGIWPPMVAIESPSMEPNMDVGDLVFVVDNERFVPDAAVSHDGEATGVVPADRAAEADHRAFGKHGDVIIYRPDGSARRTPIIHRAMLFVEDGENWYDRADPDAVGAADSCAELNNCPAPHAGFVTLGDNNARYDQQTTLSAPVRPEWIVGTAEVKVPYLGYVRLAFSGQVAVPPRQVAASAANDTAGAPVGVNAPSGSTVAAAA